MLHQIRNAISKRFESRRAEQAHARAVQTERDIMEAAALNRLCDIENDPLSQPERDERPHTAATSPAKSFTVRSSPAA